MIQIDKDRCDFCGTCVGVCPENCMDLGASYLEIEEDICTSCSFCVIICPVSALEIYEE